MGIFNKKKYNHKEFEEGLREIEQCYREKADKRARDAGWKDMETKDLYLGTGAQMEYHEEIFMKCQDRIWSIPPRGTKKPLSHLYQFEQFKGQSCFIISGGPSLREFDFNQLNDKFTIGINKVCQFYTPDIMFNQDPGIMIPFFKEYGNQEKTTLVVGDMDNRTWDDCYYVRCAGQYGISNQIDRIHTGSYSCYGVLNLAIVLGFNPIYLLGYDFQEIDGKDHVIDDWGMPEKYFEVILPKALL